MSYFVCRRIWLTEPRCIVFLALAGDKQRHMLLVFLTAWEMNLEFGLETRNLNPRGLEGDRAGEGWQRGSEWAVSSWFYLTHWEWVDQLASLWIIQTLLEAPCFLREDFWGQKKDRSPSHRSRGRSRNSEERYMWRDVHRVSGSLLFLHLISANVIIKLNTVVFWAMPFLQE